MKEKLLAALVLLSLLSPVFTVNAAVLPGQEETGEGFWAYQLLQSPISYSTSSVQSTNVQKIDAENGIIIKNGYTTPQGNYYLGQSSINSQYIVQGNYINGSTRVNLVTKLGEQVDIPDNYENVSCIAVGVSNDSNTRYLGCKVGENGTNEIVLGRISKGQVKIQKKFNLSKTAYVSFNHEYFQGYNNAEGKYLAFNSIDTANYQHEIFVLDIETGLVKNVSKQLAKAGFTSDITTIIGWRNNSVIFKGYSNSTETLYKYNVAENKVTKIANVVTPVTSCTQVWSIDAVLNSFKAEDNNVYMNVLCSGAQFSYVVVKVNLSNGKITELVNSKTITPEDTGFGKLEFSNKGNFLGISAYKYSGYSSESFIYSLNLKTNKFGMIKHGFSLL